MVGFAYKKAYMLLLLNIILLLSGCEPSNDIPTGLWYSINGRPTIQITEKENEYVAIVFHRTHTGTICPVEYPVVRTSGGTYIQGEGRIIISYSKEKNRLFLSPGGIYIRSGD